MQPHRTLHHTAAIALAPILLCLFAPQLRADEPAKSAPEAPAAADDELPPEDAAASGGTADPTSKKSASLGSVSDEITTDKADSTPDNPRAGGVSNHLAASFNLGEQWAIDASFDYNATQGTAPAAGAAFGDSGGKATSFSLGADFDPNDHVSLGASLSLSPKATTVSDTSLTVTAGTTDTTYDARLRADNLAAGLGLTASYDTAGDSDLEWTFSGSVTGSHLVTTQVVTALAGPNGKVIKKSDLIAYCNSGSGKCKKSLRQALQEQQYTLDSVEFGGSVMATIFTDTDLRVGADVWAYSQDPNDVGFFSITGPKSGGASGGGGVPIAPMQGDVKVELTQRIGAFSARLSFSGGSYVAGTGGGTYGGGLRLQYKFTKAFRLWLTLAARHDVDAGGADTVSRSGSLGVGLRF